MRSKIVDGKALVAANIAAAATRLPQARLREQPHKPRNAIASTRRLAPLPAPRCARPSPGRIVKTSNEASGDFGHNPQGRGDLGSGLGVSSAVCLAANKRRCDNAMGPERALRARGPYSGPLWDAQRQSRCSASRPSGLRPKSPLASLLVLPIFAILAATSALPSTILATTHLTR